MHARLRGSKSLLTLYQIINKTWFPFPIKLPQNALRRDFNGKCIELIEGHYLEVVVEV